MTSTIAVIRHSVADFAHNCLAIEAHDLQRTAQANQMLIEPKNLAVKSAHAFCGRRTD